MRVGVKCAYTTHYASPCPLFSLSAATSMRLVFPLLLHRDHLLCQIPCFGPGKFPGMKRSSARGFTSRSEEEAHPLARPSAMVYTIPIDLILHPSSSPHHHLFYRIVPMLIMFCLACQERDQDQRGQGRLRHGQQGQEQEGNGIVVECTGIVVECCRVVFSAL